MALLLPCSEVEYFSNNIELCSLTSARNKYSKIVITSISFYFKLNRRAIVRCLQYLFKIIITQCKTAKPRAFYLCLQWLVEK